MAAPMLASQYWYSMMTVEELSYQVTVRGSLFFNKDTMYFFGDTLENFSVHETVIKAMTNKGIEKLEVYDLHRISTVERGLHGHCAYFRKDNFEVVFNHA